MPFTQTITVEAETAQPLADAMDAWHREQQGVAPGYEGARLLADQDQQGRYVIEVDFSSRADAAKNNTRSETEAWAAKLQDLVRTQPEYRNYEVTYTTG